MSNYYVDEKLQKECNKIQNKVKRRLANNRPICIGCYFGDSIFRFIPYFIFGLIAIIISNGTADEYIMPIFARKIKYKDHKIYFKDAPNGIDIDDILETITDDDNDGITLKLKDNEEIAIHSVNNALKIEFYIQEIKNNLENYQ